ncbi:membrane protein insertase YidC [bacterium]|nr:membrane protein insertase YidC [bacterium]
MDKHSFIGLILIFVIVTLWFSKPYQKLIYGDGYDKPKQDSTFVQTQKPSETSTTIQKTQESFVQEAVADSNETSVLLKTQLYEIELSNVSGGSIKNFRLLNYKNDNSENSHVVNLVNNDIPYFDNFNVLLKTKSGQNLDLKSYEFVGNADFETKTLVQNDSVRLVFTAQIPNLNTQISKVFTFYGNKYDFRFSLELDTNIFADYKIVWNSGLANTEKNFDENMAFNYVYYSTDEDFEYFSVKDNEILDENFSGKMTWSAVRSKYFALAVAPIGNSFTEFNGTGYTKDVGKHVHQKVHSLKIGGKTSDKLNFLVYFGPLEVEALENLNLGFENLLDLGWFFIKPFTVFFLWFFSFLHNYISNYGIVIFVFALLIKIALHPLTHKSLQATEKMAKLQPEIQKLNEKYEDDAAKKSQETFKLYQKHGVNPFGSCLPTLLQFPILIALYNVFRSTIELRGAYFFGWMTDLSQPDTIYVLPFALPFYGNNLNLLPVLMSGTMFWQSSMTVVDPKQKMMIYLMPVMMLVMFNNFPAGLTWYYFLFNIFSIIQQYWIKRTKEVKVVT